MGKQTICLSMIVKNEATVIRRCLDSVRPLIDAWAIVDTGSTDDTVSTIGDSLAGIPGRVSYSVPPAQSWLGRMLRPRIFDFAQHRNVALDLARTMGCEYILTIDADEIIRLNEGSPPEFPPLTLDRYVANFRQTEGRIWHRSILIRSDVPWYYKHPIHEVLHCDRDGCTAGILGGLEVMSYSDGGRNLDKHEKYLSDVRACRAAIRAEPDEPRHWFYLGQSLAGAGKWLKAIRAYERRIELGGGWDEEVWYSLYQIAPLRELLGHDWREVCDAYLRAYDARPWRAEPLWGAGVLCRDNGSPALGELYLRAACTIPQPEDSFLIAEDVYRWRAADDLCGCLAQLGKRDECLAILRRMVDSPDVPEEEKPRMRDNIAKGEAL